MLLGRCRHMLARYIDLEGQTHKSIDVGGYRHNKGFCEKFTFLKSINRGRMTIIEVPM